MSTAHRKNLPASVRQRLLNLGTARKEPFDLVLVRFGIERLLYRLSRSRHAGSFLLKGAMLFVIWSETAHRPTRDLDLLGFGPANTEEIKDIFVELCMLESVPDGLTLLADSVVVAPIREQAAYPGLRVTLEARLENVRIPLQVDIGFGDVVTPKPEEVEFPTLLDFPAPQLRAYPIYTVIAEKLEAMVRLGEANTRMKDFFDVWYLCQHFAFEGELLREAITRTFARRELALPTRLPGALSADFAQLNGAIWISFLRRHGLHPLELSAVIDEIRCFAWPVVEAAKGGISFTQTWQRNLGWHVAPAPSPTEK